MKNILYISALLLFLVTACEDPIDVNLDEAPALLVVDAWLNDIEDRDQVIKLNYSHSYFDSLEYVSPDAAIVTVTTGDGTIYDFQKTGDDGTFSMPATAEWLQESVGQSYTLNIEIGDDSYSATTEKYRVPQIDSIKQEERIGEVFTDDGIYCNFFATDLPGLGDTYWVKTYKNGEYLNRASEINIAFDAGFNAGGEVDNLVFIQPIQELNNPVDENFAPIPYEPGDEIRVELHSISNAAFFYMEVLRDQLLNSSNSIFAEPQANTTGNISSRNGEVVLGFFNVASVATMTETIR